MNETTISWLLEDEDPSVKYLTLKDLLNKKKEAQRAKREIPHSKIVKKIFSKQDKKGFWESKENPYTPKYRATYWQIMLLGYLEMDKNDERIGKACEYIFTFQQKEGGFSEAGREKAQKEYKYVKKRYVKRGKNPPEEDAFIDDLIHQMELSCLTGNICSALIRLGYGNDKRVLRALTWLVEVQNGDGGWLCPYWKAHIKDTHSCFYGTICALEAFSEAKNGFKETVKRSAEFLLMHRLYKADHHNFEIINKKWLELSFPWFYGYDILRGLYVLTKLGIKDERMKDAVEIIKSKEKEGKWILEKTPNGRMHTNIEKKGRESKWITLHALRVLNGLEEV